MLKSVIIYVSSLLIIFDINIMDKEIKDLKSLIPENIDGWQTSNDKYYSPETLYDYIDGGAETIAISTNV